MKNFTVFLCVMLSVVACNARSFKPPCSPRPEALDNMIIKCFREHVDLNSVIDYADDPDTNIEPLNNFKACTLRELGLLVDGKINFHKVEALINKWIINEESAKNINEFLNSAIKEANKEYGESAIAHKFYVIVNKEEDHESFINGEFCP